MFNNPFYSNRYRCFICNGTGNINICKNPIKEKLTKKEKTEAGNKDKCPLCNGIGVLDIDKNNNGYRRK